MKDSVFASVHKRVLCVSDQPFHSEDASFRFPSGDGECHVVDGSDAQGVLGWVIKVFEESS